MTKPRYAVMLCSGCYTVERTTWQRVDNGKITMVRDIAAVFSGQAYDFAYTMACNFCDDLNKMLPVVEQRAFPVFKRPMLLEQLAAL